MKTKLFDGKQVQSGKNRIIYGCKEYSMKSVGPQKWYSTLDAVGNPVIVDKSDVVVPKLLIEQNTMKIIDDKGKVLQSLPSHQFEYESFVLKVNTICNYKKLL